MLNAASVGGSILVLIALFIALLKALISFVGLVSFAIKAIIVLAFLLLFIFVAMQVWKGMKEKSGKSK
ncbi:MAG: hypothetical protein IPM50_13820 [Acidobacteriota bacterium]|nr:MAG: hypothetical protein IPM50_13820 [Acidobacteriota bacterium]